MHGPAPWGGLHRYVRFDSTATPRCLMKSGPSAGGWELEHDFHAWTLRPPTRFAFDDAVIGERTMQCSLGGRDEPTKDPGWRGLLCYFAATQKDDGGYSCLSARRPLGPHSVRPLAVYRGLSGNPNHHPLQPFVRGMGSTICDCDVCR
jgi:hypothetical protein